MPHFDILNLFQGIATMVHGDPIVSIGRIVLIALGIAFIYLGAKGTLEPLIMIPMGLGMAAVNAAVLYLEANTMGTIFIDPMVSEPAKLLDILQIDFLQPIYTFTFSNGLIACLVFMGIGAITDVGFVMMAPFRSMIIAIFAELGTIVTFPIAVWMGLNFKEAAAISVVGGADGPMVLFTSLILAKDIFVPITIVAYLYLSLTYGVYPYLIRLLVPKKLRGIKMDLKGIPKVTPWEKITFSIITCTILCLLFPVAAPFSCPFSWATSSRNPA
jgi:oxaloacetate decarboxylase beta subunit